MLTQQVQPVSISDILLHCENLVELLTPSPSGTAAIEEATRKQHDCKRWHEERYGRLTSSGFGEIIKCRQYEGHAQRKIYPSQSNLSTAAIQWGKQNEPIARQLYEQHIQHRKLRVHNSGLWVSNHDFLAASPDGTVYDQDGSLKGILEIKCPHTHRNVTVNEACKSTSFCCSLNEDNHNQLEQKA